MTTPTKPVSGYLIAAFVFVVTWQQNELKPKYATESSYRLDWERPEYYTVETVEHSIKLKTRKDVDLFVGKISDGKVAFLYRHIIPIDAFNIKVEEKP